MYVREDWTLFRNLSTISQKAGVPLTNLRRLVMKELVDNALDTVPKPCNFGKIDDNTYFVEDDGPGIEGDELFIANLFSINRPLTSSKILRLPTRGALGNGLRVVVGTAYASGGWVIVETRRRKFEFHFDDVTGQSKVSDVQRSTVEGTKITIRFGKSVPTDKDDLEWARIANELRIAQRYTGKSSPWWYDSDSFYELLLAAGSIDLTKVIAQFDGVKSTDSIVAEMPKACGAVSRENADTILQRLRVICKQVSPKKIGGLDLPSRYMGEITIQPGHGQCSAILPYVVEAWATPFNDNAADDSKNHDDTEDTIQVFVNATPITGEVRIERRGITRLAMFGCGIRNYINNVSRRHCHIMLAVTIPYMPITTDGKEPNFLPMLTNINKAISKATRVFKNEMKKKHGASGQSEIIKKVLNSAINSASGDGEYRFSLRQLFYAVRPHVLERADNQELDYNYFAKVITDYEAEQGEISGMYRDPRGTLYHPHLRRSIPIGTIAVEMYERPKWTFNKILYCEKEGFFPILQQVNWPERHDCAMLSSKGFASRAVRDILDLLGETDETIQFFCIHDSDASGTLIYQALTEGTTARAARRVEIIDLGLNPWDAVEMGLQIEKFTAKKPLPVATYVQKHDYHYDTRWKQWLQGNRIELNAMTSPQFLDWLDKAIAPYSTGKVIPPEAVLIEHLHDQTENLARQQITAQILEANGFEGRVKEFMNHAQSRLNKIQIEEEIQKRFKKDPNQRWDNPIALLAKEIVS